MTQPNQPPAAAPTPTPPPVTATPPPPQPRASSLPPETTPVQNIPGNAQSVGSPAAEPRKIERQLSNSTTSSLDDILSSSPDVGQITTASKFPKSQQLPEECTRELLMHQKLDITGITCFYENHKTELKVA